MEQPAAAFAGDGFMHNQGPIFYVPPLRIVAPPGVPPFLPHTFDPLNFFNSFPPPHIPTPPTSPPPPPESHTIGQNLRRNASGNVRPNARPNDDDVTDDIVRSPGNGSKQPSPPGRSPSDVSENSPSLHEHSSFDDHKEKKRSSESRPKRPASSIKRCSSSSTSGGTSSALPPRHAITNTLRIYDALRRNLLLEEESKDRDISKGTRPDLNAGSIVNLQGLAVNRNSKVVGTVPGIEVGDQFYFRMEMCCVGMHGPIQGGIEYLTMKESEYSTPVAISIISSGGYDAKDDGEVLIYTGQGGKSALDSKPNEDQKLERGNLAMEGSMKHKVPVRVTRGIKDTTSPSGKTYTYDGLYRVEQCWSEKGKFGFEEFKFKLRRLPGQPELGSAVLKLSNSLKQNPSERQGLCLADISDGKEVFPVCVVNTVDSLHSPQPFQYSTSLCYPQEASYYQQHFGGAIGCDCKGVCNVSQACSCYSKNGSVFAYLNGGVLVKERAIIYECGSNCKCPLSCRNRLTQRGMKYRLEVFKTEDRGWGLRSWDSIPAGSFICEYTGKLIENTQPLHSRDYLLDTSRLPQNIPQWGDASNLLSTRTSQFKDFAPRPDILIDSSQTGNVSRFINHSCSPNVFAQCVAWNHHDSKHPHIMLFAMDNIPPFNELTMDYGTQSPSLDSRWVAKLCLCGSEECKGIFYT